MPPLYDFAGPIINAFLQGRDLKNQQEQRAIQNQRATEESMRQDEALKLQKQKMQEDAKLESEKLTLAKQAHKVNTIANLAGLAKSGVIDAPTVQVPTQVATPANAITGPGVINEQKTVYAPGAEFAGTSLAGIATPEQQDKRALDQQNAVQQLDFSGWLKKQGILQAQKGDEQKALFSHQEKMADKNIAAADKRILAQQAFMSQEHALQRQAARDLVGLHHQANIALEGYREGLRAARETHDTKATMENMIPLAASGELTREDLTSYLPISQRTTFLKKLSDAGYNLLNKTEVEKIGSIRQIQQYKDLAQRSIDAAAKGDYVGAVNMKRESEALLASLGRMLGERGAFSNSDIERYKELHPVTLTGQLGIDPAQASRRMQFLDNLQTNAFERTFPASMFTKGTRDNMKRAAGIPIYTIVDTPKEKPTETPAATTKKSNPADAPSVFDNLDKQSTGDVLYEMLNKKYKLPHASDLFSK